MPPAALGEWGGHFRRRRARRHAAGAEARAAAGPAGRRPLFPAPDPARELAALLLSPATAARAQGPRRPQSGGRSLSRQLRALE
eukprot:3790490-Pyramimonas_sp.AAC.1